MKDSNRFATIMICFLVGFVLAIGLQIMYDQGIIIADLLYGTITLRALQFVSILLWTIIGAVLSAR